MDRAIKLMGFDQVDQQRGQMIEQRRRSVDALIATLTPEQQQMIAENAVKGFLGSNDQIEEINEI